MNPLKTQELTYNRIKRLLDTYVLSDSKIRPHFFLSGPSGSGKTALIEMLSKELNIKMLEINAAAITKEGLSGNSLTKALAPAKQIDANEFGIIFVDEFDKLFVTGNANSDLAHESTNGVQNEFLAVLEKGYAQVFGDYGHYDTIVVDHLLFVFAGAFNGELGIDQEWLKGVGVKTEFLGRVPLYYNLPKAELSDLLDLVDDFDLLKDYFVLEDTPETEQKEIIQLLKDKLTEDYPKKSFGIRYLTSLVHQLFINGSFYDQEEVKQKKIITRGGLNKPTQSSQNTRTSSSTLDTKAKTSKPVKRLSGRTTS